MMLKNIFVLMMALSLASCATHSHEPDAAPTASLPAPETRAASDRPADTNENIDLEALQRALRLGKPPQELGYEEASYNTCTVGYGYSSSQNCRRLTMAMINFRLQCRDSEGTISNALGASDLRAIAGQSVGWTLQKQAGLTTTDGEGYATLRGIFSKSPKNDWLKISVNAQYLNMRAQTITRVVAPRPWCHQD